nr:uncharacterized protein LOC109175214 isoform X2 [Ipomoea batatas]
MLTLGGIYKLLAKRLFGKCMVEAAKYGVQKELLKKGGELAAANLEARLAYLVAKQVFLSSEENCYYALI